MKKVLIICDFSELIIYKQVNARMIRHLYTLLFLFEHYIDEDSREIRLVDRSGLSYQPLWKAESSMSCFIDRFITTASWNEISFITYDMIICHYELEVDLNAYLEDHFEQLDISMKIFSMLNPFQENFEYFFPKVDTLFAAGSIFEINEAFKKNQLYSFKKKLHFDFVGYTSVDYESFFRLLRAKMLAVNEGRRKVNFKRILILDDYKRRFYIGDSTLWLKVIRRLLRYSGDFEEAVINCDNSRTLPILATLYKDAFPENVSLQGMNWDRIDFSRYDLIILETDVVLKFFLHIDAVLPKEFLNNTSVYTISPVIDNPILRDSKWDFFENNLKEEEEWFTELIQSSDKEIFISKEESTSANRWLERKGVTDDDDLIVLLNGSSRDHKVILMDEFLVFIELILQQKKCKVLVFDSDFGDCKSARFTTDQKERIINVPSHGIRGDLNILVSRFTKAIIGPCTGMLHLANGAFIYLLNRRLITANQLPFMMAYTGKQYHDIDYLPHNWWSNTLVSCAVIIHINGEYKLVSLDKVVRSTLNFRKIAGSVSLIKGHMLYEFLSSRLVKTSGKIINI